MQSLTVTDTVNSAVTGTQTGIAVRAAAASTFIVTGFLVVADGGHLKHIRRSPPAMSSAMSPPAILARYTLPAATARGVLPADHAYLASDSGVHSFSATLKTAASQSLTVSDTSVLLTGTRTGIVVWPAAAAISRVRVPLAGHGGRGGDVCGHRPRCLWQHRHRLSWYGAFCQQRQPGRFTDRLLYTASDSGVHTFSATLKTLAP